MQIELSCDFNTKVPKYIKVYSKIVEVLIFLLFLNICFFINQFHETAFHSATLITYKLSIIVDALLSVRSIFTSKMFFFAFGRVIRVYSPHVRCFLSHSSPINSRVAKMGRTKQCSPREGGTEVYKRVCPYLLHIGSVSTKICLSWLERSLFTESKLIYFFKTIGKYIAMTGYWFWRLSVLSQYVEKDIVIKPQCLIGEQGLSNTHLQQKSVLGIYSNTNTDLIISIMLVVKIHINPCLRGWHK